MTATDVTSVVGLDVVAALAVRPRVDSIRLPTRPGRTATPAGSR